MIADAVGRFAMRDLPDDLAFVQIDRRDAAVRRLDERQPLDEQAVPALAACAERRRSAAPGFDGSGAPVMKFMSDLRRSSGGVRPALRRRHEKTSQCVFRIERAAPSWRRQSPRQDQRCARPFYIC